MDQKTGVIVYGVVAVLIALFIMDKMNLLEATA
jgi:hypothetical protein